MKKEDGRRTYSEAQIELGEVFGEWYINLMQWKHLGIHEGGPSEDS